MGIGVRAGVGASGPGSARLRAGHQRTGLLWRARGIVESRVESKEEEKEEDLPCFLNGLAELLGESF